MVEGEVNKSCDLPYACDTNGLNLIVWYRWEENCFEALNFGWSPAIDIRGCSLCFPKILSNR